MDGIPYIDVDYCQFSDWGYKKPTRIWGSENLAFLGNFVCDGKNCSQLVYGENGYLRHRERLGGNGMRYGTKQKWRVPEKLVFLLLSVLDIPAENYKFLREDYSVKNSIVQKIEKQFGCHADRDCFANYRNSQCTYFFSEKDDAPHQGWKKGETLWLNPPWILWEIAARKLLS